MFAYCINNPISFADSNGNKPEYSGDPEYEWMYDFGWWLKDQTEKDKEAIKNGEVIYSSGGTKAGGKITNSCLIKTPWVMYDFIEENRGDEVSGSTIGLVWEWIVHNLGHTVGTITDNESWVNAGRHVDFGNTIYLDNAHGVMTALMTGSYAILFPLHAQYDMNVIELQRTVVYSE